MAAPAESRTPNWHRAKIAQLRVRMEGWRQRRLGRTKKEEIRERPLKGLDTDRSSHGRTWCPISNAITIHAPMEPNSEMPYEACACGAFHRNRHGNGHWP